MAKKNKYKISVKWLDSGGHVTGKVNEVFEGETEEEAVEKAEDYASETLDEESVEYDVGKAKLIKEPVKKRKLRSVS